MVRWCRGVWIALACLAIAAPAGAGVALVDLLDGESLEHFQPTEVVSAERALDLLLLEVVRERIASGALTWSAAVPVFAVGGDPGPSLAAHARLRVGELVQLVLLGRSRSAIATLAAAVGPGPERARLRMRRAAARLDLRATTIADTWPAELPAAAPDPLKANARPAPAPVPEVVARTTVGDLGRLAAAVVGDAEIRRRLALDGAPIADGALIVRATDPLIARMPTAIAAATAIAAEPARAGARDMALRAEIAIGARDGLELLAVATGADAAVKVWQVLERGFARYRRLDLVRAGQPIGGEVPVSGGVVARLTPVAAQAFAVTVRRGGASALHAWWQVPKGVVAPVATNQPLGEVVFEQAGRIVGAVPLIAPAAVAPNGWLDTARR